MGDSGLPSVDHEMIERMSALIELGATAGTIPSEQTTQPSRLTINTHEGESLGDN
jgi:hypothetical protein